MGSLTYQHVLGCFLPRKLVIAVYVTTKIHISRYAKIALCVYSTNTTCFLQLLSILKSQNDLVDYQFKKSK